MSDRQFIVEVLEKLKEITGNGSTQKKVDWLRRHDSPTLRMLLRHNFDPNIHYDLPEGNPPYRKNPAPLGLTETNLLSETRKLSYLWLTPYDSTLKDKVEAQAVKLAECEQIHAEDRLRLVKATAEIADVEDSYQRARTEHEAHLTLLSSLEEQIATVKKRVDQSRVEMSQAKVKYDAASGTVKELRFKLDSQTDQLNNMRRLHAQDTTRLKKQPSSAPKIDPLPSERNVPRYRLESMFVNLLEALHPSEADVVLSVKNKTLEKDYAITKGLVEKAFPDLL